MGFMQFDSEWNNTQGKRAPTLAHQAALELREQILSGELAPGQPLLLVEMAERLGMSIMPVREALRRLEFEGLVEQLPQRGARVSALALEDVADVYHARIVIESRAVMRAVLNFNEGSYTALLQILQEYRQAYEMHDEAKGRRAHEQFHFGLYTLSKSAWTVRLIRVLWDTSERYRRRAVTRRGSVRERFYEHLGILEACRRGDVDEASNLMAGHLKKSFEIIKEGLDKLTTGNVALSDRKTEH